MNYYVMENGNNAFFQEDFSGFSQCCYGESAEGQASGVVLDVDLDSKKMKVEASEAHTMVEASTESCKTRRIAFPYMLSCCHSGSSMVVHDCKGELLKFMEPTLKKNGYRIVVINFRDLMHGERYNVLERPAWEYKCGNKGRGIEMFKAIISTIMDKYNNENDPFWQHSGLSYFLMLACLCCEVYEDYRDVTFENILKLHIQCNENIDGKTYISHYFEMDKDNMLYTLASITLEGAKETRNSIYSIFLQAISDFIFNECLCDMCYNSTFDVKELIEEKTAVFLITRDEDSVYDPLVASIVHQFYILLVDEAHKNYNAVLPKRVEFILDEFANMGKLADITKMVSAARSRGIRFFFCIQSVKQLNYVYGDDVAKIILDNCNNTVYLHSTDMETLKQVSDRCGQRMLGDGTKRPLISVEKLQHLNKGQALFLLNRVRPFFSQLPDASEYGVPFSEEINIMQRDMQTRKAIDFRMVAKDKREQDLLARVNVEPAKEDKKSEIRENSSVDKNVQDSNGVFKRIQGNLNKREEEKL